MIGVDKWGTVGGIRIRRENKEDVDNHKPYMN
jgi:hypothetical protein